MGIFFGSYSKFQPINEVEVNGQELGNDADSTDYTADDTSTTDNSDAGNNDTQEQDNSQEQPQENQEDQNNQQDDTNQNGDENPVDYTSDDDYNMDDEGEDTGNDDQGGQPAPDASEEEPVDDIKKKEEELFASLSAEQLDIKHKELKTQYLNMFDNVNTLIDKIGNIAVNEENAGAIEYVSTVLTSLHDTITDYMNSVYKTKSYTENSVNYNRFLAVLSGINKILEEIAKNEDK